MDALDNFFATELFAVVWVASSAHWQIPFSYLQRKTTIHIVLVDRRGAHRLKFSQDAVLFATCVTFPRNHILNCVWRAGSGFASRKGNQLAVQT